MTRRAFVFPGQGSQAIGMGKDLAAAFPAARHVFEEVDEALFQPLSRLMFEGDPDDLTRTTNAQPALLAVSMAVLRVLETDSRFDLGKLATVVAGHSLGEYTALCAAGSFSVTSAARLLRIRGEAMQAACPEGLGAMAALLGLDLEQAEAVVAEAATDGEVCMAANDNAPGQVVVSGHRDAVARSLAIAGERGARRSVMLATSAPFHCTLMQPAAVVMADALSKVAMQAPKVPLMANVTASVVTDVATIRELLVKQVTGRVRWRESVQAMAAMGVDTQVELGAGKVLSGLVRRIDRAVAPVTVSSPADIESFLATL